MTPCPYYFPFLWEQSWTHDQFSCGENPTPTPKRITLDWNKDKNCLERLLLHWPRTEEIKCSMKTDTTHWSCLLYCKSKAAFIKKQIPNNTMLSFLNTSKCESEKSKLSQCFMQFSTPTGNFFLKLRFWHEPRYQHCLSNNKMLTFYIVKKSASYAGVYFFLGIQMRH